MEYYDMIDKITGIVNEYCDKHSDKDYEKLKQDKMDIAQKFIGLQQICNTLQSENDLLKKQLKNTTNALMEKSL